jgi:murein DD-endopeptidase MepM/ murein hydrolase activator NlpD
LLPDSEVVYSSSALDFDVAAYLQQAGGALSNHQEYLSSSGWTTAADIVARVALENSINPRLLLALLEQQCACVLGQETAALDNGYSLGVVDYHRKGLYGQLWWAANQLSTGYYGWREGWLSEIALPDGTTVRPAPDSNAGSVAVQNYFASLWGGHDLTGVMGAGNWHQLHPDGFNGGDYRQSIDPVQGFVALYGQMFGDPWSRALAVEPLLQAGLQQPELSLPFEPGRLWAYTSGPHRAWESEGSRAALDFAPAAHRPGCLPTDAQVLAVASGIVTRVGPGLIVQDLDGSQPSDGREQTGWSILYMHVDHQDRFRPGDLLQAGDPLGSPSCLGGRSTGTHLHIARKYNGEWIAAGGALPFVLSGWTAHAGEKPYEGVLLKDGHTVVAHPYANYETNIRLPGVEGVPAAPAAVNATPMPYWLGEPVPQPEP